MDCIEDAGEKFLIGPDVCDCGAFEAVCPVNAIFYEDFVPEFDRNWIRKNSDYYN